MTDKFGKKKTVIEASSFELEKLVRKHYPEQYDGYEFVAVEECGNDSSHNFNDIDGELSEYDLREFNTGAASNRILLNKLCVDGFIEAGSYLIQVCW